MKRKIHLISTALTCLLLRGYASFNNSSNEKLSPSEAAPVVYSTIGDILASRADFPTSIDKAWLNPDGDRTYIENNALIIENSTGAPKVPYALDSTLGIGIGDYIYTDIVSGATWGIIHFHITDNILDSIRYESYVPQISCIAGTYAKKYIASFINDEDNITNKADQSRSLDSMVLPDEEYDLYIIKPKSQGGWPFFVEFYACVDDSTEAYGCLSLNPKEDRKVDHLEYSLDGISYTKIESYNDNYAEIGEDAFLLEDVTGPFFIKSVGASSHILKCKYDALKATSSSNGHKEYYECNCHNHYFEDEDLLNKIGDSAALDVWLNDINGGLLVKLPKDLPQGVVIGTIILAVLGVGSILYVRIKRKSKKS